MSSEVSEKPLNNVKDAGVRKEYHLLTPREGFTKDPFPVRVVNDSVIVQGDIRWGTDKKEVERMDALYRKNPKAAMDMSLDWIMSSALWPDGIVWYRCDNTCGGHVQMVLKEAMKTWQDDSDNAVKFEEDTKGQHVEHLLIKAAADRNAANIGRTVGGVSIMELERFPTYDVVLHELGHVLGFAHEHCTPDRDDYVTVHYEHFNDYPWLVDSFAKQSDDFKRYNDEDKMPYDYGSIMHYQLVGYPLVGNVPKKVQTMSVVEDKYQIWKNMEGHKKLLVGGRVEDDFMPCLSPGDIFAVKAAYAKPNRDMGSGGYDESLGVLSNQLARWDVGNQLKIACLYGKIRKIYGDTWLIVMPTLTFPKINFKHIAPNMHVKHGCSKMYTVQTDLFNVILHLKHTGANSSAATRSTTSSREASGALFATLDADNNHEVSFFELVKSLQDTPQGKGVNWESVNEDYGFRRNKDQFFEFYKSHPELFGSAESVRIEGYIVSLGRSSKLKEKSISIRR